MPRTHPSTDDQHGMALYRTEMALERTQLAWIRTAFSIISAGLALDKGAEALHSAQLIDGKAWLQGSHTVGVALTALATIALAWATLVFAIRIRELLAPSRRHWMFVNPAIALAGIVVVVGTAITLALLILP